MARCEAFQSCIDFSAFGFNRQTLDREIVDRHFRNARQHFEVEINDCILAGRIIMIEVHVRLGCRAQLVIADRLLHSFLDRAVKRFLQQGILVHLLDEVRWNLAGAEAGHAHLRRNLFHFAVDPRLDVGNGDGYAIGPLQAFILGFLGLHN